MQTRGRQLVTIGMALVLVIMVVAPVGAIYDPPTRLSGEMPDNGDVEQVVVSPDGRWAVFTADLDVDQQFDLWSVPLDGTANPTPTRLNDPAADGDVSNTFEASPDSTRVVYVGDLDTPGVDELYSAPIDGAGSQVRLNDDLASDLDVDSIRVSPDSGRVVYLMTGDDFGALFSAPIDAPDGQVLLNEPTVSGTVLDFDVASDSSRVAYRGNLTTPGVIDLYSAPIDVSGGQIRLSNAPLDGDVGSFEVSPDSRRVVYLGDLNRDDLTDLYAAPLAAAGGQVRLSQVSGDGTVESFVLAPDSRRVAFAGDLTETGVVELYSAPIDAGGGQIRLNDDPPIFGAVNAFGITVAPDSTRVVYRGDLDDHGMMELYSAPIDREGGQVKVNAPPSPDGGGVQQFRVTPDGARVAYTGSLSRDLIDLYSAPVDGSGPQVRLNDPATSFIGGLDLLGVAPDGGRVVYVSDQVYSAPVGVAEQQVRVSDPPLPDFFFLTGFAMAPDSSFVVYVVDQDERFELFASGRGQLPAPAPTGLAAADVRTTTATVSWTAPPATSQVTGFEVTTTPTPAGSSTASGVGMTEVTGTSVTLDGLDPSTTYTVEVRTINDAGLSEPSPVSFTTASEPAPDPEPGGVARLFGPDRFATAAEVALDRFDPAAVDTVYLATGRDFPDALAGGPLAANDGAPILLATADRVPEVTADALATLAPSRVVALGGTAVLPDGVLTDAAAAAGDADTDRLSGPDRFATAAAVAAAMPVPAGTVYLATGRDFPDALAGGPLAAGDGAPILLATADGLPAATVDALGALAPERVVALGGTAVLPDQVLADAAAAAGGATTDRLAGTDRFATAAAIAAAMPGAVETAYVATGRDFPDALTGVPAAAREVASILLATPDALPDPTVAHLDTLPGLRRIVILGGTAVIGESVETDLAGHLP